MPIATMPIDQLLKIVRVGGGITVSALKHKSDSLLRLAKAARNGARLEITDVAGLPLDDLIKLASAGEGAVSFTD